MKINDNKLKEQNIVLQNWKNNNYIGTYAGFTGVGKTRIGTIAAGEFIARDPNETSIIIVPTENLRDNEWESSFAKWGYSAQREKVKIVCIQSAYKYSGQYYDTIVIDEVHTALSNKYGDFLRNNTYKRLLCLTATPPEDMKKLEFLTSIAPVIWETPRERAIQLKLVSPSIVFNLGVDLTKDEELKYKEVDKNYKHYEDLLGGPHKAFDSAQRFMRLKDMNYTGSNMLVYTPLNKVIYAHEANDVSMPARYCRALTTAEVSEVKQKKLYSILYHKSMRERKTLLINAYNKIDIAKNICARYPDRKAIIFSESTYLADKITESIGESCVSYHTKMLDRKLRKDNLSKFMSGEKTRLSSVKALNAGMDVEDCSLGVATSGNSKKLDSLQRNGRTSRYIEGKVSYFINMFCRNTQEAKWILKNSITMEPKWIDSVDELPIN